MSDVDTFLAHYGVLGMHWGKRKARKEAKRTQQERDRETRAEIMRGKNLDEVIARNRKEKKLVKLVEEDLHPRKVQGKAFVDQLLVDNGLTVGGILLTGATAAAGAAFMALRIRKGFGGISMSPIALS